MILTAHARVWVLLLAGTFAVAACDKGNSTDGDKAGAAKDGDKKDGDKKDGDKKDGDKKDDKPGSGGDSKSACVSICDKTVECAEAMAKSMGAPEETVKAAKAEAEKGMAECKSGCEKDAKNATDEDKKAVKGVEECVAKKDCSEYIKCMEAMDSK